jgi:hypothetical protein
MALAQPTLPGFDGEDPDQRYKEAVTLRVHYSRFGDEPAVTHPKDWKFRLKLGGLSVSNVTVLDG